MKFVWMGAALAVGAGWWMPQAAARWDEPHTRLGLEEGETHAAASLMGQFRTNLAAWLWVRADLYLHNGVELRPMTESEHRHGREGAEADAHDHLMDESAMTTVVPAPEFDFRGILGDLDRATQAYRDMRGHQHRDPEASLPLFRLMTWADPNFVMGWAVGASVLGREHSKERTEAAIDFLRRGIEANPGSELLKTDLAQMEITRTGDLDRALVLLRDVVDSARRHPPTDEDDQDQVLRAWRWLSLVLRQKGEVSESVEVAREGLLVYRNDPVLARHAFPPPTMLLPKAEARYLQDQLARFNARHERGAAARPPE
ncbi:MAG: hypothetical protein M9921_03485 [Fimbriimonadaceae bacterium]|nr:hypothetical protein [Chthonomonadaceae bacterium]MCO5295898.1 hypothetical protein [Fimbriimonadaceae bacterium]